MELINFLLSENFTTHTPTNKLFNKNHELASAFLSDLTH